MNSNEKMAKNPNGGLPLINSYRLSLISTVIIVLLLFSLHLMAGTTGKIAGIVENEVTGEPIPGATIRVIGSDIVTQTDADGEYFIINLPAGIYSISVSIIGYENLIKEDVRVLLDLTTPVDFELEQVELPLQKQLKVYAKRPPIQRDLTASRGTLTSDRLMYLPNAITVDQVVANMAGTVIGRDSELHVRGGRSGTVAYIYDGFSIQDVFSGDAGIRLMPDALEEINLTLGGFPAEYGEALSGIVNAVSKEGTNSFHGKLKFYDGYSHKYSVEDGVWNDLSRTKNNALVYNLSGPLPHLTGQRSSFFTAGEYRTDDGYLPHNELEQYTQTAKVKLQPSPNWRITALGSYFKGKQQAYEHRNVNNYSYDFNLDGLGRIESLSYLYGLKSNYNLSEKSVLSLSYNHFFTETKRAPDHLFDTYWDEWPGYSEDSTGRYDGTIHEDNMQLAEEYFLTGFTYGDDFYPFYRYRKTSYDAFAFSITSQVNKQHQFRAGSEIRKYELFWDDKQFFNQFPYGEKYNEKPTYATIYAQDKLEVRDLIVNAGLRWDYLNSEVEYWPDVFNKESKVKSKSKSQISPRLGFSHPISDRSVIKFNYGYFFQAPNFRHMYTNLQGDISSGLPIVGNPDLKAEKTIAYELGLSHLISDDFRLDMTVYYKDIENLIAAREIGIHGGNPVTQLVNEDYASAKGLDITLEKIKHGNWSGMLVYSYLIAKGNSSSAYEAYYNYITNQVDSVIPVNEYPLAFDQRHTATLSFDYRVPPGWKGSLLGVPFPGAWGINLTAHYGSGLPYTITGDKGANLENNINDGRLPSTYNIDMRFNKDVYLQGKDMFFSFFIEIENLFDRRNVIDVYNNTGRPDDDGRRYDGGDPDGDGPGTADDVNRYYRLMAMDPQNYSQPRKMRVGLEFNF